MMMIYLMFRTTMISNSCKKTPKKQFIGTPWKIQKKNDALDRKKCIGSTFISKHTCDFGRGGRLVPCIFSDIETQPVDLISTLCKRIDPMNKGNIANTLFQNPELQHVFLCSTVLRNLYESKSASKSKRIRSGSTPPRIERGAYKKKENRTPMISRHLLFTNEGSTSPDTATINTTRPDMVSIGIQTKKYLQLSMMKRIDVRGRKNFNDITQRGYRATMLDTVLAEMFCLLPKSIQRNGEVVLYKNEDLMHDCEKLIDSIKNRIQHHTRLKFDVQVDEVDMAADGTTELSDDEMKRFSIFLSELMSKKDYAITSRKLKEMSLPMMSWSAIRKIIPRMYDLSRDVNVSIEQPRHENDDDIDMFELTPAARAEVQKAKKKKSTTGSTRPSATIPSYGARFDFEDAILLQCEQVLNRIGVDLKNSSDTIGIIHSTDGAKHQMTQKGQADVITCSVSPFSRSMIEKGVTTSDPHNIFTIAQIIAKEDTAAMRHLLMPLLESVDDVINRSSSLGFQPNIHFYEVHDGKAAFNMSGKSKWNRLFHPMLLCYCRRGEKVADPSKKCSLITQNDMIKYVAISKEKKESEDWSDKQHRDWCDVSNYGITHFGFDPRYFNIERIRIDVFHMRSGISRKLLNWIREKLLQYDLVDEFAESVLISTWEREYFYLPFVENKTLSRLQGKQILEFIHSVTSKIVPFFQERMETSEENKKTTEALVLWVKISEFMSIVSLEEYTDEEYLTMLEEFQFNIESFYIAGRDTFLTHDTVGDQESYYTHALHYQPNFALKLFRDHHVGLGIFSMQGFEHRNKESKCVFRRHTNGKGNLCMQSLKQLFLSYTAFQDDPWPS